MKFRPLFLLVVLSLLSFTIHAQDDATNLLDACVTDYDAETDYFPDHVEIEYAEQFDVAYFNNYKLLTVSTPWGDVVEYALVQCGTPAPEGFTDAQIIDVPVESVVSTSTTFLPHIVNQGMAERVLGLDSLFFTSLPELLERIDAGEIVEVYADFAPNLEVLVALDPALIILQDFSPDGSAAALEEVGIQSVLNYDFNDTTPLGQAEWGKFIAVLFNTEAEANAIFDTVVDEYTGLLELTADVEDRPLVMSGEPYQGAWFIPGGQSYAAQLYENAGADYILADNDATGGVPIEFEAMLEIAAEADIWVSVNWNTLDEALTVDPNFSEFSAFVNGEVYAYNAAIGANGGNLYFEEGAANPHIVLADLIAIFQPDLLPDHELVYYRQVPQGE
ncbi:MAG: ABC transporter substrate-binding protein [Aggregatilineales bacterium]